jgi:hypothetical protein
MDDSTAPEINFDPQAAENDAELKELLHLCLEARKRNDKEEELKYQIKIMDRARFLHGSDEATHSIYFFGPGALLVEMNRFAEAEPLLRSALASYSHEPYNPFLVVAIVNNLIQALEAKDRKSEADELAKRPDYVRANSIKWM